MKTLFLFSTIALLLSINVAFAQKSEENEIQVKRFRIGIKTLLYPNLLGGHAEFVLPVAKNRVSLASDVTYLPLSGIFTSIANSLLGATDDGSINASYTYFNLGSNFYYGRNRYVARGGYIGASYGYMGLDASVKSQGDELATNAGISLLQFRLGTKTGTRGFYFGTEIGYGYPISVTGYTLEKSQNSYIKEKFPDVPAYAGIILNFSIGVAIGNGNASSNSNKKEIR